jgi:hypothetical protein
MKQKIVITIVLITLALGIVGYWYYQKNTYSKEVLQLEILSSDTADLGEEVEYIIKYKNNGNVRLEDLRLTFEYPEYSILREENKNLRFELDQDELGGPLYPLEERTLTLKARLLGEEGEAKVAKAWLSYKPKNLNASYESATTFTTIIDKASLSFDFDLPSKVEPDKEMRFRMRYSSNVDYPLSDLRVEIDYPSGFEFVSSRPKDLEEREWDIGVLNTGDRGEIEVTGILRGDVNDNKIFNARLGSWQDGEYVILKEIKTGVEIVKPEIFITQEINGNYEYVASPGELLHYEIFFKNLSNDSLSDLFLVVDLNGEAYDLETIKTFTGDHNSGEDSIIFDWRKNPDLRFLDSQEEGKVEFWIDLKEDWGYSGNEDKNPMLVNEVKLSQASERFETKINSNLSIDQKGYFEDEVFGNSGRIPPKVGENTTYTIIWHAKNYYNEVGNVKVRAKLGEEVKLTGNVFPDDQKDNFSYDSDSKEIVWDLGDLEPGTGVSEPLSIAFQVSLRPNGDQRGDPVVLVEEVKIAGEDQWTEQAAEGTDEALDTTLPDDPTVDEGDGYVR